MHPILLTIGPLRVPSYGALLVTSFLIVWWLVRKEAVRVELDRDTIGDTAIAGLLFGLLGAKVLLIIVDLPAYLKGAGTSLSRLYEHRASGDLLLSDFVAMWHATKSVIQSTGVVYGGLIAGVVGVVWYIHRHKLPLWKTLDLMAPFTALGVGLGRMSCLMAGCCHGIPYDGPLALTFPDHPACVAPPMVGLFPIQLLALLNGLLLFSLLRALLRRDNHFQGQVVLSYLFLYGLTRSLLELLRGDSLRGIWFGGIISTSQLISLFVMGLAVWLYLKKAKEAKL